MIKACLFDLDGTILDTVTTIAHYGNGALAEFGIEPIPTERYNYLAGKGARNLMEGMLKERGCYSKELFDRIFPYYMNCYDANPTYLTEPFEGIVELLEYLKSKGMKAAVISNKPDFAARTICKAKFDDGLLSVVRGQVDGVANKPATDGVKIVADRLGVTADEVLYIGDTDVDMQTGKNFGAYTVGVLWGFRGEEELNQNGADILVSHPHEIVNIIERMNAK